MNAAASHPARSAATAPRGSVLVAVPDRAAADQLPAAARQARRLGARLIVGLARPRSGFTTDAAIARHIAVKNQEEQLRLRQLTHRMLHGSGVNYDIMSLTYRDSRSPAKRERRIAAAMTRLAHRSGAIALPAAAPRSREQTRASSSRLHVVAVLPDSAEAVHVARAAAKIALAGGSPLACVVPLPAIRPTGNPDELTYGSAQVGEDMAAIAGRVRPTLERLGFWPGVHYAPYRTDVTFAQSHRDMAAGIEAVARRLQAQAIVVSAHCPALPHLQISTEMLHVVESAAQDCSRNVARGGPSVEHLAALP